LACFLSPNLGVSIIVPFSPPPGQVPPPIPCNSNSHTLNKLSFCYYFTGIMTPSNAPVQLRRNNMILLLVIQCDVTAGLSGSVKIVCAYQAPCQWPGAVMSILAVRTSPCIHAPRLCHPFFLPSMLLCSCSSDPMSFVNLSPSEGELLYLSSSLARPSTALSKFPFVFHHKNCGSAFKSFFLPKIAPCPFKMTSPQQGPYLVSQGFFLPWTAASLESFFLKAHAL